MKRHNFDIFSFVSGLVFAGLGVSYLINDGRWRLDAGPWLWPVILLAGGAVVLIATLRDEQTSRTADTPILDADPADVEDIEPSGSIL